ncbi:MAG: 1,4-dihydroxy-2-naphthoate polyprenyltransferase [Deltaproteobacteria bacterium]|nr:1,4-dihydroxy-2-naphthoate polyprenyltransferase [Deltaproteobacteria bacterium]
MFTTEQTHSEQTKAVGPGVAGRWIAALRPKTLPAAFGPVALGVALAAAEGAVEPLIATLCAAGALLLQIASNLANDAFDTLKGADGPDRLGPTRAAAAGWLTPRQLLLATALTIAAALGVGAVLILRGGWPIALIGLSGAAAAVLYTGGPRPLGYLGLGDALVFLYFGLCAVGGTVWVHGVEPTAATWLVASGAGALATAILVVNNLRDRASDARAGKRTLAVRLGARTTRLQHSVLCGVAFAVSPLAWLLGLGDAHWMLAWLAAPLGIATTAAVWRTDGAALNPLLGRTAQLGLLWSLLLAVGIVWGGSGQ